MKNLVNETVDFLEHCRNVYCEDLDIDYCKKNGIPKGVVLSNEKLSDYFNKNYIDHICNKGALKAGKGDI